MPRSKVLKPHEVAGLAKALEAEGFCSGSIQSSPDGTLVITWSKDGLPAEITPLEEWKATRNGSS